MLMNVSMELILISWVSAEAGGEEAVDIETEVFEVGGRELEWSGRDGGSEVEFHAFVEFKIVEVVEGSVCLLFYYVFLEEDFDIFVLHLVVFDGLALNLVILLLKIELEGRLFQPKIRRFKLLELCVRFY